MTSSGDMRIIITR